MLFPRPLDFLPIREKCCEPILHCQLTALGIPRDDPDSREPLAAEQRLKLLELELVVDQRLAEAAIAKARD